uniref:ATP synthase complex subunit 8 n=1 Tax=Protoplasa fitchii TaxID=560777 RepID=G8J8C8_9DIPT|nr:ATP synthase F0 subunit 8 [Protoplasa fitchii]AET13046.1 ATP synthase F0 subunit 8 [Protoplasa fitchii]
MPQMAPISWLSLFLIFSMTFMLFNIMNYFSFLPKSPNQSLSMTKNKINSLNWKW